MAAPPGLTSNIAYLGLIFALIVIPRALQRFRLPAALSSFGLGMLATALLGGAIADPTLRLLSTLGISSLFLFAGLDVDVDSLKRGFRPLLSHLILLSLMLAGSVWLGMRVFALPWATAALTALALLTPSTGFILEALPALGLNDDERFWVAIKAVGGEILALLVVFVILQSGSSTTLATSSLVILFMVFGIPLLLRLLVRLVVPYAPGAEFSLLLMVGLVAAYLTERLGINYLFGAFLAGFIARQLRSRLPKLASDENLRAIQLFASFFIPFYFFGAGMSVPSAALTWDALRIGLVLTGAALPLRIAVIWLQRRFIKGETALGSLKVAIALSPTLIFTLVLAAILRQRFGISAALFGGLLVYAAISTLLPSLVLARRADPDDRPQSV
ncbi:MAG TPA: cation:proton antiporter [Steroidobacteraceae bacterium]|nr:cation:proton antiporter [Steroidobacteraceae bacterium]